MDQIDAIITLLVWDAREAVARLFESLDAGPARRAGSRLFILDQGSSEETRRLIHDFQAQHSAWVDVKCLGANIGYPAGHNLLHRWATRQLSPRYVVTINSDLEFLAPDWLDTLVDYCDGRPDVGIAGPGGIIYQRAPAHRIGWCREAGTEELARGEYDAISGSVCIIRQQLIEEIGLFDESFTPGYYEDTDLCFRARSCGWSLGVCPIPVRHRPLGDDASTSHQKRDELSAQYGNFQKRNRDLFVSRWLGGIANNFHRSQLRSAFPRVYFPEVATACSASVS